MWRLRPSFFGLQSRAALDAGGLPQTNLLGSWYVTQYQSSPRGYIPNAVSTSGVNANVGSLGRNHFQDWGLTSVALTDGQTDSAGGANATRIVGTGGSWGMRGALLSYNAGTYTSVVRLKSNTGASQTVKFGHEFTPTNVITVTTSWQRFAVTFTKGSPGNDNAYSIIRDGADCDILIDTAEIYVAGSDPGDQPADSGHMILGTNAYNSLPTYASGELDLTGNTVARAFFPTLQSVSTFTAMAAFRKTAATSSFQFPAIIAALARGSASSTYQNLGCFHEIDSSSVRSSGFYFGGSFTARAKRHSASTAMWELINRDYFVVTWRYDGTVASMWVNDVEMFRETVSLSSINLQDLIFNSPRTGAKVNSLHIWTSALTDAQIESAQSFLLAQASAQSLTIGTNNLYVAWLGDSQFAGTANGAADATPYIYAPNAPSPYIGSVYAASGAQLSGTVTHLQAQIGHVINMMPAAPGSRKFIAVMQIGANDNANIAANTYLSTWAGYCDSLRAVGIKVVVCTLTNRKDALANAGFNTWRNTINTEITTNWLNVHCDGIADIAATATMGGVDAPDDTTYFSDKLHWTDAGHVVVEGLCRTAVNALAA